MEDVLGLVVYYLQLILRVRNWVGRFSSLAKTSKPLGHACFAAR